MFGFWVVPPIILTTEFRNTKCAIIFYDGFGARTTHGCAQEHEVFCLNACRSSQLWITFNDCIGSFLKPFKIKRLIEFPLGSRGRCIEPKSQRAGTVISTL